jgi:hypothetical protein
MAAGVKMTHVGKEFLRKLGEKRAVYAAVVGLVAVFFVLAVTSVLHKSNTYDETIYLPGGYSYWKYNDYRINSENGNLPQRWVALPLWAMSPNFPSLNKPQWDSWQLAFDFFYMSNNSPSRMILAGRVMIALLAAAGGVLVYVWSSRLYGRGGGLISAVLYCFSTAILAHGRLMTADLAVALFFLASVGCLWRMLHRFSALAVLGSAAVMGLLFVSKMSAAMIVPMGVLLAGVRLVRGGPIAVKGLKEGHVSGRWRLAGLFASAAVVHAVVVVLIIWAFGGFRYSAIHPALAGREQMDAQWSGVLAKPFPMQQAIVFARDHRLLPEAYLYGQALILKRTAVRPAFLNGQYSIRGWWWFFPYCVAVKTPLSFFAILALAAAAAVVGWWKGAGGPAARAVARAAGESFYRTAPLWVLMAVYGAAALASHFNIGHRHILPIYPPLFILAGSAVSLFRRGRKAAWAWVLGLLLAAYAAEGLWTWPNYLAYFNQLAGGPRNGYRHLVESSLDWGQDLPGLKRWLDRHGLSDQDATPVYLSYFGTADFPSYGLNVRYLTCFPLDRQRLVAPYLSPGVYCISATLLQNAIEDNSPGPWTLSQEQTYWTVSARVAKLLQSGNPNDRQIKPGMPQSFWGQQMELFDQLRSKRLFAYLRHREPDDEVGYSILIYRLSSQDIQAALFGPPAEIKPEDPSLVAKP